MKSFKLLPRLAAALGLIILVGFSTLHADYYYLGSDDDDAEERITNGDVSRGSSDLEMAYDDSGSDPDRGLQIIGLRFNAVSIPVGATITSAKIRFRADNTNSGTATLNINGQLANDASGFSTSDYDLSSRTQTTASVTWNAPSWTNDLYYETDDISSVVQEIINQAGYTGDDLVLFIRPGAGCTASTCLRRADSRDQSSDDAPRLEVTYTLAPPPETPPSMGDIPNQSATVGVAYSLNIASYVTLTNGDALVAPYYTLTGTLPSGLSFNSSTGVISGTPTASTASSVFTVIATDNDGASNADSFTITVTTEPAATNNYRDFTLRKQLYTKGNMKTIGNTVLVPPTGSDTTNHCATYTNGTFIADATSGNNSYFLCGYHSDTVNSGTFTNSTTSELALPVGSNVLWAGLYWQGIVQGNVNINMSVKLRRDGSSYVDVTPSKLDYINTTGYTTDPGGAATSNYSAFADVSAYFGEGKWNEGNYTIANVPVYEGKIGSLGTYGAWTLVVVYEDTTTPGEKFRSFSVFDGWKAVNSTASAVPVNIDGFYTPNRTNISAKVSVFAAEGDKHIANDLFNTTNYNTNTPVTLAPVANNSFNSSISGGGARTPTLVNNNGIDIQTYDIGAYLKPKQTDMTFTFTSTQDAYWPSMLAFSTELVAPQLCYDYSYKQDGAYLKLDNNGTQLPLITGFVSSSPIDTSIYVRNNEADIKAQGVSFYTDVNASVFQYIDNSVYTSNINGSALIARTDTTGGCNYTDSATTPIGCNNGANIRIGLGKDATGYSQSGAGSLGDREFVYAKFSMDPIGVSGIMDINQSVGLHLNYYIVPKTGATPIPYDYEFGTDIPLCPPSGAYEPTWGTFNVVESGAIVNNLRTKVSRNPFNVDVAAYGKNPVSGKYDVLPASNIDTTLLVEIIDSGAYHDANATCANPDAAISQTIFVPITASSAAPTDPVPLQNTAFHNFAVQNGAFRIWYFDDANQTLIQNWTATTSDTTRLNLTSINGLYKSSFHTQCATECVASTSVGCFECIKANYAKPLCSRDNFAVRPESYDLRIYDVNQTLVKTDPVKDSTKIALSEQYQYPPTFAAATGRVNLAAGYDYRYDMNATGHDGDLSKVPGYTRYFNGTNSEYNATMIWEPSSPKTGCNNENSRPLTFYVANGQMSNEEAEENEVGEYRSNIIDTAWTEVDWKTSLIGHHIEDNGFAPDPVDCIIGTTSTVLSGGKIGCTVSSSADAVTPHVNGIQTYKDHLLTFKPYHFDLTIIGFATGKQFGVPANNQNVWTYMNNVAVDENMSVRYSGQIRALGENNSTLSNFVTNCYAEPVNLDLNLTFPTTAGLPNWRYRLQEINASVPSIWRDSNAVIPSPVTNTSFNLVSISESGFLKNQNGLLDINLSINFDRNQTLPVNPITVGLENLQVKCQTSANCSSNADMIANHLPDTNLTTDSNITFAYGRLLTKDIRVFGQNAFVPNGWYEVFNLPTFNGTAYQPSKDGVSWFINAGHDDISHGDANVTRLMSSSLPNGTVNYGGDDALGVEVFGFPAIAPIYNGKAHVDTAPWLWFAPNALPYLDPSGANPANAAGNDAACLTHPCFNVTVMPAIGATGSAKSTNEANKDSKRSTGGTGWRSTTDYSPAIR